MTEVLTIDAKLLNMASPCCDAALRTHYNTYVCVVCRRVYSLVRNKFEESGRNHSLPSLKRTSRLLRFDDESPNQSQESSMDSTVTADPAEVLADAGLDPKPAKAPVVRRGNGALETQIRAVTDAFVQGVIDVGDKPLTPYRIAKLVDEKFPGKATKTSTGAVTECLKRWRDIGFAELAAGDDTPMAFVSYTDDARSLGLRALKERYRAGNKAKRAAEKAANAPAPAPTPEPTPEPSSSEADSDWEYPASDG